jgi:hypothetical protein
MSNDRHKVLRERLKTLAEIKDSIEFVDDQLYATLQKEYVRDYIEGVVQSPAASESILAIASPKLEVFFSYSSADNELCQQLLCHLSALKRQGSIHQWRNCQITAGQNRIEEIDRHLDSAHVILLLVSADFIESDHCFSIELKKAMERHEVGKARVIPIVLREVDYCGMPFERLDPLPQNRLPVTSWKNQDEAFTDIAKGVRIAVEEMLSTLQE